MKEEINAIIEQLSLIPVSGLNAIRMGNALVGLVSIRDGLPDADPKEGEEDVNSND